MAEYTTKNYTEQGGERTVIGGELVIAEGGKLKLGDAELKQAENVPGAAGSTVTKAEFAALLDSLIAAGIMAAAD